MTATALLRPPLVGRQSVRFVAGALIGFVAISALSTDDGPVLCPFRRCTGGYCPGCGMTRSGGRLLRGDVVGSWAQHPYLLLALAQVAVIGGAWRLASEPLRQRMARLLIPVLAVNLTLMLGIWTARIVDGSIPAPFAGF